MTGTEEPNLGGRPSAYRPEMCQQIIELGRRGKSPAQIAGTLGVKRTTMLGWRHTHPEFGDALEMSRVYAQQYWEDYAEEHAHEKGFNTAFHIKLMQSRFADWRDVSRTELTGPNGDPLEAPQQITKIELVAPSFDRNKENRDNIIDLVSEPAPMPSLPEPVPQVAPSNLGEEKVALRTGAELLRLYDQNPGLVDELGPAESKRLANAIATEVKQKQAEAEQAELERKARQEDQRLRLPPNIGGRKKWVR